ncbi:MAG: hypothetical protein HON53_18845 [Planctomycetaceae bacterium]|jgi:hypothetical protein|nr:hypothetical protein [Planctomycetaceae bacterium]MBT6157296.1 hypothetical protein [Planctomycetaceae bacterium]MBT6487698.1 hypothetical protein [Planctomycetaceae bacterium]MBT6494816.1 hypothetical protein [Planctomycetaceae bacterium]
MADPRIPIKNQYLAAVLAYLVPGAGHLYQGRMFKGTLYLVCILGTYLAGLYMSQWKAVYYRMDAGNRNIAFFAQAGVGMFAIPAYVQAKRYAKQHEVDAESELPLSAEFHGVLVKSEDEVDEIVGRIELAEHAGDFGQEVRGKFTGKSVSEDGQTQPLELNLAYQIDIGLKVGPGAGRGIQSDVVDADGNRDGWIRGVIPRSFVNHFAAPLQSDDQGELSGELGKFFELAKIFTWIAGLLNILAVWDAFEGPAYGYGDEEESTDEAKKDSPGEAAAATQSDEVAPPADKAAAAEEPVV